ncbi:MAG: hypothetical protein LAP39_01115 [Acidobacteriia bacterium]|nr:hypothetical protein [Terriglobia bacterium]
MPPLLWILHGLHQDFIKATLATMAIGLGIGGVFFLGMLGTAIGYDVKRNWGQREPTLEWNPLLFWKVFLYAGSLMFLTFGFLSYRQGWWLSVEFGVFAILCWLVARGIAVSVRRPKRSSIAARPEGSDLPVHSRSAKHWAGGHLHPGFVGMEYFALILNRSFLVFITEDGLRSWQFRGVVSSLEPLFYEPVEVLLDDPDMTPGAPAFEELMQQRRTLFVPYTEIRSVEFVNRQKWGMGPISHAGRLRVQFRKRRTREFILLGNANGNLIRDMIASRIQPERYN